MFKYRRVLAFLLDTLFVSIISILLIANPKINKYYESEETYSNALLEKQSHLKITSEDENIVDTMYEQIGVELYDATKVQGLSIIIYLIVNTLYYSIFAFFNDGKTLGCALFKIKIMKKDNKKANLLNLTMRSLFMGSSFIYRFPLTALCMLIIPRVLEPKLAFLPILYSSSLFMMLELVLLVVFITNKKGMTIQDYLSNTKIIDTKK